MSHYPFDSSKCRSSTSFINVVDRSFVASSADENISIFFSSDRNEKHMVPEYLGNLSDDNH